MLDIFHDMGLTVTTSNTKKKLFNGLFNDAYTFYIKRNLTQECVKKLNYKTK